MTDTNSDHDALKSFAEDVLGQIAGFEDCSRGFGRKSVTWRITAAGQDVFYLKRHEERRLYETEQIVYTKWLPKLRDVSDWNSPELVGNSTELGALLMTSVPGEILEDSDASLDDQLRMHRSAGQLASQIHQLDVDASEAGPPRLYGPELWERYLQLAAPYLDSETLEWVEGIASQDDLFGGLSLVPTHSDFSPRNWLIHRSGANASLGLIDWERARAGFWLEDGHRLVFDHWRKEPRLRAAFYDGYGHSPTPTEERQLNVICLANALGTVPWAIDHGDFEFAEFGRRVLTLLKDELG